MAEPLYRKIDFTADLAVVWERLQSGWEWLGVDEEGEFVLGYPRREEPPAPRDPITITRPGARVGQHGVRIESPPDAPRVRWYATESEARTEFLRVAEELRQPTRAGPSLALVQRVEGDAIIEEIFVASPST